MNTTILNREFQHPSDDWYQIEALGQHPNQAAGVVQVIDAEAARRGATLGSAGCAPGTGENTGKTGDGGVAATLGDEASPLPGIH